MQKKLIIIIVTIVIIGSFGYAYYSTQTRTSAPETITQEALNPTRISQEVAAKTAVLLDVRTAIELEQDGFAVDSSHFDLAMLQTGELPNIDKNVKIYTYCKAGTRAGKAETILEENGYVDVVNIGGLVDWINAGGEIIK